MPIQKKIFYSILLILTIVYSLSIWFYYIYFENALIKVHKNQISQINEYVHQDIKRLDDRYKTLIKTLHKDIEVASLYDHIPWLVMLSKKIVRRNFETIFKRYPYLREVSFYQNEKIILKLNSQTSDSPPESLIKYEEKLNFKDAKMIFKIDLINFIQTHLKENKIIEPSFVYLQNEKGNWLIKKNSFKNFEYKDRLNQQIEIDNETFIFSSKLKILDFTLQSSISLKELTTNLNNILYKFLFAYFFTSIAIFFIARYISSFITKPLDTLEKASNKIMTRDFSQIKSIKNDETKNAILAFNLMSQEIKSFTNNLQEKVDKRTKELKEANESLNDKISKAVQENQEQERLIFFQNRLATMGETINIIAHQWRQPISIISSYLDNLEVELKYKDTIDKNNMIKSINKSKDTLSHLSTTINLFQSYLKPSNTHKQNYFDINTVLDNCINLYESVLKKHHIKIQKNYSGYLKIKGNQEYLIQVILIIINNAKDVLLNKNIKKPYIKISIKELEDSIDLSIEDNAGGVKIEPLEQIFEPYKTSKQKNNTGLGLFIARNIIIKMFDANISVSNNKKGACFKISFPI